MKLEDLKDIKDVNVLASVISSDGGYYAILVVNWGRTYKSIDVDPKLLLTLNHSDKCGLDPNMKTYPVKNLQPYGHVALRIDCFNYDLQYSTPEFKIISESIM